MQSWSGRLSRWKPSALRRCSPPWKIFRLPGTEHMEYAQKWFHVKGMLFPGSLFLVIISALTGLIVSLVK